MYKSNIILNDLLDLSQSITKDLFQQIEYPWQALTKINSFICEFSRFSDKSDYVEIKPGVFVSKSCEISPSASISGPTIVQDFSEIRHNAFIRGNVIIGRNCIIGNSCELKNSIIFNNVQVPHFNYVGDSILGYKSHLGAGAILSNVRSDKKSINVKFRDLVIETNLRKFGSIVGDFCEIGCNAVLNPGTILGKNVTIYPTAMARGVVPNNTMLKNDGNLVDKW